MMRKEVGPGHKRKQILATLDSMQHETNPLILQSLTRQPLYQQYQVKVHQSVSEFVLYLRRKTRHICKQALDRLNAHTLPNPAPLVHVHRSRPSHDK